MKKLKEMYEERAKAVKELRELNDKALAENREFTSDENTKWETLNKAVDDLDLSIEKQERLKKLEEDGQRSRRDFDPGSAGGETPGGRTGEVTPEAEARALSDWEMGRRDFDRVAPETRTLVEGVQKRAFCRFLIDGVRGLPDTELRSLQMGQGTQGGYVVAPQVFVNSLIQAVDDLVFIRGLATKYQLDNAHSLGFPSLDTDLDDSDWTTELATGSEDTSLKLGKREFKTNPFAKRIKISRTLLRNSSIEQIVTQRLAYKFAITQEKAFLTGSGHNRPLGVFVATPQGISTSRDVATDNTSTAITADGLINAKYALKGQYWGQAQWMFHRDAMKMIRKLKDGNNQYLWTPGLQINDANQILGNPIAMSEYVPNTFTTGQYVGILGDFRHYWIADSLTLEVTRLDELYAENNQVGYIGRQESDGMPVLEEAFVRVKLG